MPKCQEAAGSRTEDPEGCLLGLSGGLCGDCALSGTGLREVYGTDPPARDGWRPRPTLTATPSCQRDGPHPASM